MPNPVRTCARRNKGYFNPHSRVMELEGAWGLRPCYSLGYDPRPTPPYSFTRDNCLVANGLGRSSSACRVAGGRNNPNTTYDMWATCEPAHNYSLSRPLFRPQPPSPAILYHGTLRIPQRRALLDNNLSLERRYRHPHRHQEHFGNHPCESGVRVRYSYFDSRQGERSRFVPLLMLTSR
jgi:hypothetical protein